MIETKDLVIAKGKQEDWKDMYENVWSHAETARYMQWRVTTSEADAQSRMARTIDWQRTHDGYLVYEKRSGRAIGFAGVERIDAETCGETGIALGPAYVRRGYGRQIVTALCRYCRETYGARYFRYCAREKNAASRALAVSLGFAQTGAEDRTDERDGLPYRIVVYQKEI